MSNDKCQELTSTLNVAKSLEQHNMTNTTCAAFVTCIHTNDLVDEAVGNRNELLEAKIIAIIIKCHTVEHLHVPC